MLWFCPWQILEFDLVQFPISVMDKMMDARWMLVLRNTSKMSLADYLIFLKKSGFLGHFGAFWGHFYRFRRVWVQGCAKFYTLERWARMPWLSRVRQPFDFYFSYSLELLYITLDARLSALRGVCRRGQKLPKPGFSGISSPRPLHGLGRGCSADVCGLGQSGDRKSPWGVSSPGGRKLKCQRTSFRK